ncbi:MAG: hypothetical protein BGO67_12210 [Alphaproteobacteria bacterium 41-28]|nr:MAG: hypothetical protein BGO67_12210 [Alphaproteobacteria bacterium 41-28]
MKEKMALQEFEDWIEDSGMESLETVTELLKVQQQGAIELTKLILEHCNEDKKTKDYIFKVYGEALKCVSLELSKDF